MPWHNDAVLIPLIYFGAWLCIFFPLSALSQSFNFHRLTSTHSHSVTCSIRRKGGRKRGSEEGGRKDREGREEGKESFRGRQGGKQARKSLWHPYISPLLLLCIPSLPPLAPPPLSCLLFLLLCSFSFFFLRFHHRKTPERALYIFSFRYFCIFLISYQSFSLHVAHMLQWPLPCRIQWSIFILYDTWEIFHTAKQLSFLKILPHPTSDNILEINAV